MLASFRTFVARIELHEVYDDLQSADDAIERIAPGTLWLARGEISICSGDDGVRKYLTIYGPEFKRLPEHLVYEASSIFSEVIGLEILA